MIDLRKNRKKDQYYNVPNQFFSDAYGIGDINTI